MKHFMYIIVTLAMLFPGCDYLDTVPKNDIETVETIFEKKEQVEDWLQTCYDLFTGYLTSIFKEPSRTGADEVVAGDFMRQYLLINNWTYPTWDGLLIGDGLQMAQEPYGNAWKKDGWYASLRYCNIFLQNIDRTYNMTPGDRQLWTAEIKALKAHIYFELMRRYGPVILVPQNIELNEPTASMQQPRAPIDSVVKAICDLCDEAMEVLPPMKNKDLARRAFHSEESVATLKAMALFYAASPLFNGEQTAYADFRNKNGELLFPPYDKEKIKGRWKRAAEAVDEAIAICLRNGKDLISGDITQTTKLLRNMADIEKSTLANNFESKEAILMFHCSYNKSSHWAAWTLPKVASNEAAYFHYDIVGSMAPSMKMVEMYYTEHGLPIDADTQWDYTGRYQLAKETSPEYRYVVSLNTNEVLGLHLRREPRFYANIAADRCYWQRGDLTDDMVVKCYRNERYGTRLQSINPSSSQNLTGYYMKKDTYSTVSNKNYGSKFNGEEPFIVWRLADLYLMSAEAWNECLPAPDETHVYAPLNKVRERAGVPDVVSAWTSFSKTPGKVHTQAGMREIIHREWDIEFMFEGRRFWNLRRWLTAADELNGKLYGWNVFGQNARQFYNNFDKPVVVWSKRKFVAPRDYLFPIRAEEVLVAGCRQNPGW